MSGRDCTFHDSYWYCYANSAAMLLSSIDEQVSPRLIEALSGVGLGASFNPPLPFFGELQPPDRGLTQALELLGFDFNEQALDLPETAPFERLAQAPMIVGPLDMSHLVYNAGRPRGGGVDHYVVILGSEGERYQVHDPAGFAHVLIDRAALTMAWRADTIPSRRGHYRSWSHPQRIASPSADAIYDAGIAKFQRLYREAEQRASRDGECIGREALLALATAARCDAFTPQQRGHLIFFGLPLGTKRALDYVAFFDRRAPRLANLKRQQALAFGACHTALVAGAKEEAAQHFEGLAALEPEIKDAILRA